jgi:integrase/recombinase XerC
MAKEIDLFLSYLRLERNRSELTVESYGRSLSDFERFFVQRDASLSWSTVDADIIREWVEQLMDKGNLPSSVNAGLSAVRSFYRFALSRKMVDHDPAHHIVGPKKQKPLPQFVREQDMNRLLDSASWGKSYEEVRARTIILMLYETGLRRSELLGLDDKDVDFGLRQVKVTGKRRKQRIVPFGDELEKTLREYIEIRDRKTDRQDPALFLSDKGRRLTAYQVYRIVREQLSSIPSLKKRSPHVLRHSFATALLNHDAGLENVRLLLGHESIETTEIYTHATFEQMKRVYKEAHPRG